MNLQCAVDEIKKADAAQIDVLLEAVFKRKRELYPQWDVQYLALPKTDWQERKRVLEAILCMEGKIQKDYYDTH